MAVHALPTGTIAFVFTDIEGSTALAQRLAGDRWSALLARHRDLIRAAVAAHGGVEVKTEGDGFFVAFERTADAVAATVDAQRALATEPWADDGQVRVRMGIHTGDGRLDADGDYVGADVHRAARVAAAGNGGQILVSETIRDLLEGSGIEFRDRGEHELKGLAGTRRVYAVVA